MTELIDEIYAYLEKDAVSFAEIERKFGSGGWSFTIESLGEAWFWFNLTEKTYKALNELYSEKKILFYPSSRLVYLIDGIVPTYPMAKRGKYYKTTHWMPVVIYRTDSQYLKDRLTSKEKEIYQQGGYNFS